MSVLFPKQATRDTHAASVSRSLLGRSALSIGLCLLGLQLVSLRASGQSAPSGATSSGAQPSVFPSNFPTSTLGCIAVVGSSREVAMMYGGLLQARVGAAQAVEVLLEVPAINEADASLPSVATDASADASSVDNSAPWSLSRERNWRQRANVMAPDLNLLISIGAHTSCTSVVIAMATPDGTSPAGWVARRYQVREDTLGPVVTSVGWNGLNIEGLTSFAPPPSAARTTNSSQAAAQTTTQATAAQSQANRSRSATQPTTRDPRVSVPSQAQQSSSPWPWIAAGVAGAALVAGFFIVQSLGPSSPVVHVTGPGTGP